MVKVANFSLIIIFLLSLSLTSSAFAFNDVDERLVLTYYYVWYGPNNPDHDWAGGDSIYKPLLGYYWSNDNKVIDRHVEWALESGIDGFILSWWGKYPLNNFEDETTKHVFKRVNILYPEFRLAIMVEQVTYDDGTNFYCWREWNHDFDDNLYTQALEETLVYVVQNYIQPYEDVYLKWNGKPVIILYAFLDPDHASDAEFYRSYFNDRIVNVFEQTGVKISLWSLNTVDAECFGVVATYLPELQAKDNPQCPMKGQNYTTIKGVKVSVVFPGYHKVESQDMIIERCNGKFYEEQWRRTLKFNPDIVFITSFNEWHESTSIEPAEEWGHLYLNLTKKFSEANYNQELENSIIMLGVTLITIFSIVAILKKLL